MKSASTPVAPRTPCVKVCETDPENGLCRGCMRTQNERDWWPAYTDDQQREVLRRCDQRRQALKSGGTPDPDMGEVVSRRRPPAFG